MMKLVDRLISWPVGKKRRREACGPSTTAGQFGRTVIMVPLISY